MPQQITDYHAAIQRYSGVTKLSHYDSCGEILSSSTGCSLPQPKKDGSMDKPKKFPRLWVAASLAIDTMIPHFPVSGGPIPWVLGSIIAVTGIGSVVLGFEALLNPTLQESGIVTMNVNLGALVPTQVPHLARNMPQMIPDELETVAGSMPTIINSGVGSVATAIQSKATTVIQGANSALRNISLGTRKICLNGSPNCKALPFDISSALPPGASDVLGDTLKMFQSLETTIFGTLRNSLIAGVTLVVCFSIGFGLTLWLLRCLFTPWRRAAITLVGFSCLVIPPLVSMVTVSLLQSRVEESVSHNTVFSIQKGDARKYCVGAFFGARLGQINIKGGQFEHWLNYGRKQCRDLNGGDESCL
ncbi:hypothetical protein BGW36DRAFT_464490 [Talaromyces proteolyticus]|uniref:Uncharacterized protein n=1 Tax=Talaromyces proteolyticus TaxID=1131652 RepID=A0AAD4KHE5_9EURO|nr:uncharacterized protein BGW36DRAFT_464490 [Talaromyces proteolyticus]KAH8691846.1 hypothetical protein BGW36DRAFT_464490 [Talaromyces proteolyticus]